MYFCTPHQLGNENTKKLIKQKPPSFKKILQLFNRSNYITINSPKEDNYTAYNTQLSACSVAVKLIIIYCRKRVADYSPGPCSLTSALGICICHMNYSHSSHTHIYTYILIHYNMYVEPDPSLRSRWGGEMSGQ